jgi:hypothetical protein
MSDFNIIGSYFIGQNRTAIFATVDGTSVKAQVLSAGVVEAVANGTIEMKSSEVCGRHFASAPRVRCGKTRLSFNHRSTVLLHVYPATLRESRTGR